MAVSVKYLRSRSALPLPPHRGQKSHGFVKMGDVEKGLKKGEEKNKLERQETDTSAEVGRSQITISLAWRRLLHQNGE